MQQQSQESKQQAKPNGRPASNGIVPPSTPNVAKTAGFQKAEKRKAWIKIAITGPSGSGKTFSALTMAAGMGKRIAVVDTENGSASLYADRFDFEVLEIDSPYTIEKYVQAIKLAQDAKFEVLIIDSISHAWAGEGGLLDQKEALDSRGGKGERNKFANWAGITKQQEKFKAWLLKADMHLLVTMRSKQDYVLGEGNAPVKVGLAPIQRQDFEYEFTTVFDLAMNHTAKASKDRTSIFDNKLFTPTIETGREIMRWLHGGKGDLIQRETEFRTTAVASTPEPAAPSTPQPQAAAKTEADSVPAINTGTEIHDVDSTRTYPDPVSLGFQSGEAQMQAIKRLFATAKESRWTETDVRTYMATFGRQSTKELSSTALNNLIKYIEFHNPGDVEDEK